MVSPNAAVLQPELARQEYLPKPILDHLATIDKFLLNKCTNHESNPEERQQLMQEADIVITG